MPLTPVRVMRVLPKALHHDGENDYVAGPDYIADWTHVETQLTVEVLLRVWKYGSMVACFHGVNGEWQVRAWGGNIYFWIKWTDGTTSAVTAVQNYELGTWYHIAFTWRKGTYLKAYLYGKLVGSASVPDLHPWSYEPPLTIGAWRGGSGYFTKADFALVRVYTCELAESKIEHNFYHLNDPVRDGLVLWLHWDSIDIDAGVWYDKSGYGNDGAIYGATLVDVIKKPVRILSPPSRIISPPLR